MSLRQLCRETAKKPSKALFYFPEEDTTGIAPTRIITEKDRVYSDGMLVQVNWAGKLVQAEILALNDNEDVLKERDAEYKNLSSDVANKVDSERPKKKAGGQKKRKASEANKENEKKKDVKKKKKECKVLRLVPGKPLTDIPTEVINRQPETNVVLSTPSPARQPEPVLHALEAVLTNFTPLPVDDDTDSSAVLEEEDLSPDSPFLPPAEEPAARETIPPQFSPLPELRRSFLSDLFDDENDNIDINEKLDRILHNQQVLFSLMSKVLGSLQGSGQLGRESSKSRLPCREEFVRGGDKEASKNVQERELEPFDSPQGGNSFLPEEDTSILDGMDGEEDGIFSREIIKLKGESCSMGNFAVKLVHKFFHHGELVNRNCAGSRGKEGLEPNKLAKVKQYTFNMYPTPSTQKEQQWKKCVIAIDESLRRKKKELTARQQ